VRSGRENQDLKGQEHKKRSKIKSSGPGMSETRMFRIREVRKRKKVRLKGVRTRRVRNEKVSKLKGQD
jgi:hypothetical protein